MATQADPVTVWEMIVAFDPGFNLGVAFVSPAGELLRGLVIEPSELATVDIPADAYVVVGNGTGSADVVAALVRRGVSFELVDEEGTSLEGRALYFHMNKPRWWARLIPVGMRVPKEAIDHYAAYAIALRWLRQQIKD